MQVVIQIIFRSYLNKLNCLKLQCLRISTRARLKLFVSYKIQQEPELPLKCGSCSRLRLKCRHKLRLLGSWSWSWSWSVSGNSLSSSTATTFGRRSVVEDVVDSTLTIFADNNDVSIPGNGTSSASNVDDVVLNTDDTNVVVVVAASDGGTTLSEAPILTIFGVMKFEAGLELDWTGFKLDKSGFGLEATWSSAARRFLLDRKMSAIGILFNIKTEWVQMLDGKCQFLPIHLFGRYPYIGKQHRYSMRTKRLYCTILTLEHKTDILHCLSKSTTRWYDTILTLEHFSELLYCLSNRTSRRYCTILTSEHYSEVLLHCEVDSHN